MALLSSSCNNFHSFFNYLFVSFIVYWIVAEPTYGNVAMMFFVAWTVTERYGRLSYASMNLTTSAPPNDWGTHSVP